MATEFTLFPNLAAELQLKIWKHAIPGPRVIKLKTHVPDWLMDEPESGQWPDDYDWAADQAAAVPALELSTDTQPSGLLGACIASRGVILGVYKSVVESKGGKKIRFDGDNDTILLHTEESRRMDQSPLGSLGGPFGGRDYSSVFSGIKKLIWSERQFDACNNCIWVLAQFQSLKEFILLPMTGNGELDTDENLWEAYLKQLACTDVQAVLSLEDFISPMVETVEQWKNWETPWNRKCTHIRGNLVRWKNTVQLTGWEVPKVAPGYVFWESPHNPPVSSERHDQPVEVESHLMAQSHDFGRHLALA